MNKINIYINNRYLLGKLLGKGNFGDIYIGFDEGADNVDKLVAIKLEKIGCNIEILKHESFVYQHLNKVPNKGIPKFFWYGQQNDYNVLIIELLGPNLSSLMDKMPNKCFSLKTTCLIAQDILQTISYIHSKKIIHRDIKPENFLVNVINNKIFTIDFGLSKVYYKENHVEFRQTNKVIGTIRYCSLNSHKGYELSRRDDLESIGYVIIYFLKGRLPWQGLAQLDKKNKIDPVKESKANITIAELCDGLPEEILNYFTYVKNLEFSDEPNYAYLYGLFINIYKRYNFKYDNEYDWTPLKTLTN